MSAAQQTEPLDPLLARLVGFGRYLRTQGLDVGTGRILSFCRAAALLDAFDAEQLRAAARVTLVSRHEDFEILDRAFNRYFTAVPPAETIPTDVPLPDPSLPPGPQLPSAGRGMDVAARWSGLDGDDGDATEDPTAIRIVASDADVLRAKDFAELTPDERRLLSRLIARLASAVPVRPSRRYRAAAAGQRFDFRRTLRKSFRTEGEPFVRTWRQRGVRQRPLVLILDVSGSMAPYGRPLVEFAHATARAGRRVEVFCFGTRLTRITRALRRRDPSEALAAVAAAVEDWEGGTRIGQSLKELLDRWSSHTALRGSVVILCSDGLERGDPEGLAKQMERLSRLAHRLIWVNPLKGSPRYEPLARGMAASLPFVDVFLPGHNLESLEVLARTVAAA